ncbi:MAG: hypothetical protein K940chlam1_00645 [Candidatus Anoxychlamydiales bacterium]|nr:hypothetical protein [Candidatus Anoxychlamydiales bacterium]NGX36161.1 hypothetical protein [Candidatus Anoxychlamydiales bacterium]
MASNVQPNQGPSQTYRAQLTNYWNNKDNSTFMKVAKFVLSIPLYPFALIGDVIRAAGQLVFGKKEEPVNLTWFQKFKNHAVDAKDWTVKFGSDNKKGLMIAGAAIVAGGIGYKYNVHSYLGNGLASGFRSIAPVRFGGNAPAATDVIVDALKADATEV